MGLLAPCFLLPVLLGCASVRPKPAIPKASPPAQIDQLNLLAIPFAVNFDQAPGPDGFVIKVYAGNGNQPKPIPNLKGTLEILMYDGFLKENNTNSATLRRTWKYSADQLKSVVTKTSIGTAYQLALQWNEAKPVGDKISIAARYTSPEGATIYSAPAVISVSSK